MGFVNRGFFRFLFSFLSLSLWFSRNVPGIFIVYINVLGSVETNNLTNDKFISKCIAKHISKLVACKLVSRIIKIRKKGKGKERRGDAEAEAKSQIVSLLIISRLINAA